jgi:hypothetical protein
VERSRGVSAGPGRHVRAAGVSQAGGVLLVETVRAAGLDKALSEALAPWRLPGARHDPAKVLLDLAVAVALGGTAWPTSRWSEPNPRSSGRWPPTRPCPARSLPWLVTCAAAARS